MYNNELQHHGILGMRWGVRRYQNKDGSLTPRGQKRYAKEMTKLKEEERFLKNKAKTQAKLDKLSSKKQEIEKLRESLDDNKKANKKLLKNNETKPHKKAIKELTDDELRDRINRLNMEKQYRELMANETASRERGKSYVKSVLADAGKKIIVDNAVDVGKQVGKYFMVKFANSKIDLKDKDGNPIDVIYTNNKKKS